MKFAILKTFMKRATPQDCYTDVHDAFNQMLFDGKATYPGRPATEWEERREIDRAKLDKEFPGKRKRREHIDKATLIARYHRIYLNGIFPFGLPANFIGPEKVVAIHNARNGTKTS